MGNTFHIQSEKGRAHAINRFCYITAAMATVYVIILFLLQLYAHALVMILVSISFLLGAVLNSNSKKFLSRVCIIVSTNFAVFYFSVLLGFKIGVHLYLFTSPLIAYLLYDFRQKRQILLTFATYLLNFLIIFFIHTREIITPTSLPENYFSLIYVLNFSFSLLLCFTLIIYFAFNNSRYTEMLVEANESLKNQQDRLQEEIAFKTKVQAELTNTIKEKETLLKEIHHRVKNNLAVISGLVELQGFYIKDEKASAILKESRNRIKSIAVLHEKFYENKSLEKIEIRSYVDELIYFIKLSFSDQNKEIKIHTQIDNIELSLNDALPFSLLLNELITNSYKHAFQGKEKGNIYISLIKTTGELSFHFKDDGCGFDYKNYVKDGSLGLNLVEAFSKQLKGQMTYSSELGKGIDFTLHFKN